MKRTLILVLLVVFFAGCTAMVQIDIDPYESPGYMGIIVNETRHALSVRILESRGYRYETVRVISLSPGQRTGNIWLYGGNYRFEATSRYSSRYSRTISRLSIPTWRSSRYLGRYYDWIVVFR